ncbi:MAG: photosynthetic complex putative assembly protein PuhB [Polymorphobacter sp.]
MTIEYEIEPIKGLPGNLPKDESIIWQGSPDWRTLARGVFHTRLVAAWFVIVAMAAFVAGGTGLLGAVVTLLVAVLGLGLLAVLAYAQAQSTVYTLTNKRIVMRFGVALPKCVNLPLQMIETADLKPAGGFCDVALKTSGRFPLGWLQMWPHVRPWQVAAPQPMLRAVPQAFVGVLADTLAKADPSLHRPVARSVPASAPAAALGVAA